MKTTTFNATPWLLAGLLCVGVARANDQDSKAVSTETRTVADFSKIKLSGSPDLTVTVGPATSVQVTAEKDILPLIVTENEGNTLKIRMTKSHWAWHSNVHVNITTPTLEAVSIDGSGDVQATGISAKDFSIGINGSGDAKLDGATGSLTVDINGSGDVHAGKLKAKDANVKIHGSGDALVHATDSLDATVAGSGDIICEGHPAKVRKIVDGSGDINVR